MTNRHYLTVIVFLLALIILLTGCSTGEVETELSKLTKKAEAGDAEAQFTLGKMYVTGEGVPKDATKAVELFQKSAAQGNVKGQNGLGVLYANGLGVPKDINKAVEYYQKAAAQGYHQAQNNLGSCYANGEGVPKDVAKAIEWYEKAAAQGNASAQTNLGWHYANGEGVHKDITKAFEWYQKSAIQGESYAQLQLAWMYGTGEGVSKDATKAVEWYEKAAVQGNTAAQRNLALMYYEGEGVPKDVAKALELMQKAASQGDTIAQWFIGQAYAYGDGVIRDLVLAYAWLNLSASKGNKEAKKLRDSIILEPSQQAEAERLSSNWKKGQILAREGGVAGGRGPASGSALSKIGAGTAFIVNSSGQAITNHHIVATCNEVRAEGREGVVKVVTTDAENDIALIQIPGAVNVAATIVSDPAKLRQGEDIVVFGFPLNPLLSSGGNLTPGVVSALTGLGNNTNQIQITAPIQPGSSGSPVLNKKGEVVGTVSMKLSDSKMARATGQVGQNVNFAVSGLTLKTFLDTHKVDYRKAWMPSYDKSNADLADEARKWTLVVECWK